MKKSALSLLAVAMLLVPVVQAAEMSLEDALDALPAYQFGGDRTALSVVHDHLAQVAVTDPAVRDALLARLAGMLSGERTEDAARFICRLLGVFGGAESVQALSSLLQDPALAESALDALERNPSNHARIALHQTVESATGAVRIHAMRAIAARSDAGISNVLLDVARTAPANERLAALDALGKVGTEEALGPLADIAAEADGAVLLAANQARLAIAARLPASGKATHAGPVYDALSGTDQPVHIRAAALAGKLALQPALAEALIRDAFDDDDPVMQRLAMGFLREVDGDALPAAFAAELLEHPPATQVLLLAALRARGTPVSPEILSALARSGDESVQLAAIDAMPACAGAGAVPILLDRAAFDARLVKRAAREALVAMPGEPVNGALLEHVSCAKPEIAAEALRALGGRGASAAAGPVLDLLEAGCPALEETAWRALRDLAGGEQLGQMLGLLAGVEAAGARAEAERAIASAAKKASDPDTATGRVLALHTSGASPALQLSLARIAGYIADSPSLKYLAKASRAGRGDVRVEALKALGTWPGSAPLDTLLDLAGSAADAPTRDAAMEGTLGLLRRTRDADLSTRVRWFEAASELVKTESEKKSLLAALGDLVHPAALRMAARFADDPALTQEVQRAQLNSAGKLLGACPEEVRAVLESLRDTAGDDGVRAAAADLLARLPAMSGFLTAWLLAGPYTEAGKSGSALLDTPFGPESAEAPEDVPWQVMPMGLRADAPYIADLSALFGTGEQVAYLMTTLTAAGACAAVLELGSNDGVKVWLNGTLVHEHAAGRPLTVAEDKVPLSLQSGENALMLKVSNEGGEWAAAARITTADGAPLASVTSSLPVE